MNRESRNTKRAICGDTELIFSEDAEDTVTAYSVAHRTRGTLFWTAINGDSVLPNAQHLSMPVLRHRS